jgi:transposase
MRATYPSDITREEFEVIRYLLESATKATHPREIDIYDVFCAVLYRLREGCRWRSLPRDFPKWQICYYHYNVWRSAADDGESILDRCLRELVESERVINGRIPQTTMIIIDSKSVKNTDTAEAKGFDRDRKIAAARASSAVFRLILAKNHERGKNFRRKASYSGRCSWPASCYVCQHGGHNRP